MSHACIAKPTAWKRGCGKCRSRFPILKEECACFALLFGPLHSSYMAANLGPRAQYTNNITNEWVNEKQEACNNGFDKRTCAVPKWLKPPGWHHIGPYKSQTWTEFTDKSQNSKYNPFPCLLLGVTCRQQKQQTFLNLHWIFCSPMATDKRWWAKQNWYFCFAWNLQTWTAWIQCEI